MQTGLMIQGPQAQFMPPPALSEELIPSVHGEWYNYVSTFTPARPLGYLMKCKANKDRPIDYVERNPDVDLTFVFSSDAVLACKPTSRPSLDLILKRVIEKSNLNDTRIAHLVDMTQCSSRPSATARTVA